jgi:hypothetical protein
MGATLVRTRQTPALTWAASTVVSQDIKATGAITRMHLRFNITPSGTLVAAGAPDGVWRVFDSLTLKGNGGVNYFSMGDQQISRMLTRFCPALAVMPWRLRTATSTSSISAPDRSCPAEGQTCLT